MYNVCCFDLWKNSKRNLRRLLTCTSHRTHIEYDYINRWVQEIRVAGRTTAGDKTITLCMGSHIACIDSYNI